MKIRHGAYCLACAALILAAPPVAAAGQPASVNASAAKGPADTLSRENLTSKMNLARQLLMKNSPAMQRISQSDDASAKAQVAQANTLFEKAEAELGAGHLEQTAKLLDEVFGLLSTAARTARDPAKETSEARARHTKLLEEIRTFQKSYRNLCGRLSAKRCINTEMDQIGKSIEEAEALARAGKYKEATASLESAHAAVVSTLNKLLASETIIVYDLKFDSPIDEFDHEVARFHSFEELIPIAQDELKPSEMKINLAERYVQQSSELFVTAKKQAAAGDHPTAIKTLQEATSKLQSALRIIGLVVPQ